MPAGLDGNPNPIKSDQRNRVLSVVADKIRDRQVPGAPTLVAIDGIDGSGKSTFADELAEALRAAGQTVVRASIDSFHNPQNVRWERGKSSPVGFFYDSHNLDDAKTRLLDPFARGHGSYVTAVFDVEADMPVEAPPARVGEDDILLFDGVFSLRRELAGYWDLTVFLDGQKRVDLTRLGYVLDDLPSNPVDVVGHTLAWSERIERYAAGMRYYLDMVRPAETADIVIDNNDLASPRIR